MLEVNDDNFNKEVIENQNNNLCPFILYFYSDTCVYCNISEKNLTKLQLKYNKKINIYKINTNNKILVDTYFIRANPTILIFDENKKLIKKILGNKIEYNNIDIILKNLIKNTDEKTYFKFLKLF